MFCSRCIISKDAQRNGSKPARLRQEAARPSARRVFRPTGRVLRFAQAPWLLAMRSEPQASLRLVNQGGIAGFPQCCHRDGNEDGST
jgi:hypothetical protein